MFFSYLALWQFRRTKFGAYPLRFTWTTESQNVSAAELHARLPSRCWSNRSPGHTFPGILTDFLELAATNSSEQRLCLFLSLDLKLFYSLGLSLNTDPTCCQRLWSYDNMVLYKFDYYYYPNYYYCCQSLFPTVQRLTQPPSLTGCEINSSLASLDNLVKVVFGPVRLNVVSIYLLPATEIHLSHLLYAWTREYQHMMFCIWFIHSFIHCFFNNATWQNAVDNENKYKHATWSI